MTDAIYKNLVSSPDEAVMLVVVGKRYADALQSRLTTALGFRTIQILEPVPR